MMISITMPITLSETLPSSVLLYALVFCFGRDDVSVCMCVHGKCLHCFC
jgi:hypothetical protein